MSPTAHIRRLFAFGLAAMLVVAGSAFPAGRQSDPGAGLPAAAKAVASSDVVLAAMAAEIERSKAQLKMDNLPAPYYVEYHVSDVQEFYAEASFGSLRLNQTTHSRTLRVAVRVGDYQHDSYGPGGQGVADIAPLDNDPTSLRRALWLATDQAYKAATQSLANKQANLTQFSGDQGYADFAHAQPLQSVDPLVKFSLDPKPWTDAIVDASNLFRTDPKLDAMSASVRFRVVNKYFVNSEGTVTRQGSEIDALSLVASTQAADGMRLNRSPYFVAARPADLPSPAKFREAAAQMVATLGALRDAPLVEEDYQGPVLFDADAADDLVASLIGDNVLGDRPRAGDTSRTTGSFSSSYKNRVLPAFLSVVDDPTLTTFQDKSLVGSYDIDDEGVPAQKISLVDKGLLTNYLLSREPIRDFPESNGHGRAAPGQAPRPTASNLILQASDSLSPDDLKKKLLDLCRDQNRPYGYLAKTLSAAPVATGRGRGAAGPGVQFHPVLLYRVYVQDGREELVRGAVFDGLDTRAVRTGLVAAGNDPLVDNRSGAVPTSVISPSLLFDDLEIRRDDQKNPKLPEYAAPPLAPAPGR